MFCVVPYTMTPLQELLPFTKPLLVPIAVTFTYIMFCSFHSNSVSKDYYHHFSLLVGKIMGQGSQVCGSSFLSYKSIDLGERSPARSDSKAMFWSLPDSASPCVYTHFEGQDLSFSIYWVCIVDRGWALRNKIGLLPAFVEFSNWVFTIVRFEVSSEGHNWHLKEIENIGMHQTLWCLTKLVWNSAYGSLRCKTNFPR